MIGRARRHLVRLPKDVADDGRFCIADIEAVDADAGSGKVAIQADTRDGLDGGYENPGQCFLMRSRSGDATIQELLYPASRPAMPATLAVPASKTPGTADGCSRSKEWTPSPPVMYGVTAASRRMTIPPVPPGP